MTLTCGGFTMPSDRRDSQHFFSMGKAMSVLGEVDGKTLQQWIDMYLDKHGPCLDKYLGHYTSLSPKDAIEQAVMGKDGKIHPHQYHVGKEILHEVARKLALAENIDRFRTKYFDELHDFIKGFIKNEKFKGFGRVAIYDTSLRLAAHIGKRCFPKDVYLHAGAKKGYAAFRIC